MYLQITNATNFEDPLGKIPPTSFTGQPLTDHVNHQGKIAIDQDTQFDIKLVKSVQWFANTDKETHENSLTPEAKPAKNCTSLGESKYFRLTDVVFIKISRSRYDKPFERRLLKHNNEINFNRCTLTMQ